MATRTIRLETALIAGSTLLPHVRKGLGAVKAGDRALIAIGQRPKVGDSLDLDQATVTAFPDTHRWDYLLSIPASQKIVGIEPHSARDVEIKVVISKRRNAIEYLRDHLPANLRVAQWFWVSGGSVRFSKMDKARRLLDQNGIRFAGKQLLSFD